jgi:hypothetical protein
MICSDICYRTGFGKYWPIWTAERVRAQTRSTGHLIQPEDSAVWWPSLRLSDDRSAKIRFVIDSAVNQGLGRIHHVADRLLATGRARIAQLFTSANDRSGCVHVLESARALDFCCHRLLRR